MTAPAPQPPPGPAAFLTALTGLAGALTEVTANLHGYVSAEAARRAGALAETRIAENRDAATKEVSRMAAQVARLATDVQRLTDLNSGLRRQRAGLHRQLAEIHYLAQYLPEPLRLLARTGSYDLSASPSPAGLPSEAFRDAARRAAKNAPAPARRG